MSLIVMRLEDGSIIRRREPTWYAEWFVANILAAGHVIGGRRVVSARIKRSYQ